MADKPINTLPVKTTPSTGDKMLMIGAAEEYQIDYDQLASAILDKLSTKQYSELDTTAKTVLGALDELNGKSYLLKGGTNIPENADMNNYTTPGNYYCISDSAARTLKNCPFTHAFTLKVEYSRGGSVPCQTFREYNTGITAYRKYESSTWIDYVYFSDDDTVLKSAQNMVIPNYKAASESDADNYMDNYSNLLPNDTHYFTNVNLAVVHSSLGGGFFWWRVQKLLINGNGRRLQNIILQVALTYTHAPKATAHGESGN